MSDCIFCKIASGEIPSSLVYQDDKVMAFKDINSLAPVHIVIIPKQHMESVLDINSGNSSIAAHIFEKIVEIVKEAGIEEDGFRVVTNIGENGGQTVKHMHFHILGGMKLGVNLC